MREKGILYSVYVLQLYMCAINTVYMLLMLQPAAACILTYEPVAQSAHSNNTHTVHHTSINVDICHLTW